MNTVMTPNNPAQLPKLPGEQKDSPPPLPGTTPAPVGKAPEWWSDPQRAIEIAFEISRTDGPKAAALFWGEFLKLSGMRKG